MTDLSIKTTWQHLGLVLEHIDGLVDGCLLLLAKLDAFVVVLQQAITGALELPIIRLCSSNLLFVGGLVFLELRQIRLSCLKFHFQAILLRNKISPCFPVSIACCKKISNCLCFSLLQISLARLILCADSRDHLDYARAALLLISTVKHTWCHLPRSDGRLHKRLLASIELRKDVDSLIQCCQGIIVVLKLLVKVGLLFSTDSGELRHVVIRTLDGIDGVGNGLFLLCNRLRFISNLLCEFLHKAFVVRLLGLGGSPLLLTPLLVVGLHFLILVKPYDKTLKSINHVHHCVSAHGGCCSSCKKPTPQGPRRLGQKSRCFAAFGAAVFGVVPRRLLD